MALPWPYWMTDVSFMASRWALWIQDDPASVLNWQSSELAFRWLPSTAIGRRSFPRTTTQTNLVVGNPPVRQGEVCSTSTLLAMDPCPRTNFVFRCVMSVALQEVIRTREGAANAIIASLRIDPHLSTLTDPAPTTSAPPPPPSPAPAGARRQTPPRRSR